jgi:hypothetical protein
MFWIRGIAGRSTIAMAAIVALCLLADGAGVAQAGEYHVYSCRMPDGQAAPTDGWSGSTSGVSGSTKDTCATDGALLAALSDGTTHEVETDRATWTFNAPVEMMIATATLWRASNADGGWATNATYESWIAGPENKDVEADVIDQCVAEFGCQTGAGNANAGMSSSNLVTVLPEYLGTHLYMNVSCAGSPKFACPSGKGDSNGYAAALYLYAADLVLDQSSQPTVTNVEGELATATTLSGTADLALHAEDPGSGVYQAVFTVDGAETGRTVLDENHGRCHDVGQTTDGLPAFLYLQPCPSNLNVDLPFDTTALADGTHHLVVSVTNAAGNSTVALDRKVTLANHPPAPTPPQQITPTPQQPSSSGQTPTTTTKYDPSSSPNAAPQTQSGNGTNASGGATLQVRWSATARTSLAGARGHAETAVGRLAAPDGAAIGGASIQVLLTPSFQGAPTHTLATARTAADGSFRVRLPAATPSSRITFAYSSHPAQPVPDITARLELTVAAQLTLRVAPRTSHVDGTIAFTGTLLGGPLPPGGKQLVLEARTPHSSWRQFKALSTIAYGHYRANYRFRLAGPITYEFRALSPKEADFPFAAGSSNVVRVHER